MSRHKLAPVLSVFDMSMMSSASMGPAYSIAATMGAMVTAAGAAAPGALIVLALCMGCVCWSYAGLSAHYPNAGSSYAWVRQAFGARVGALGAWLLMMANIFAVLATAIPAGTYSLALCAPQFVDSPLAVAIVGAVWVLLCGALLWSGLKPTAGVTAALLIGELIVLLVTAAFAALHPAAASALPAVHSGPIPPAVPSLIGLTSAMVLSIWVVDGWELSAATSEEATSGRAAGRSGIIALVLITAIVLLAMTAYMHFIPLADFTAHQADAMAIVGERLGGPFLPIIVVTVLLSTTASLCTTILYLTRSLFSMGRDRAISSWFAAIADDGTPRRALVLVTLLTTAMTLVAGAVPTVADALDLALSGSGVFLGLIFVATCLAALKLLRGEHSFFSGTVVPIFGALSISLISFGQLAQGESKLRLFALGAVVLGVPFAFWRGRKMDVAARELHAAESTGAV